MARVEGSEFLKHSKTCKICKKRKPLEEFPESALLSTMYKDSICTQCAESGAVPAVKSPVIVKIPAGMKLCKNCKEIKPLSDFYDHKCTSDGKHTWCKSCVCASKKKAILK
jgi:hypothetical protein